jgi:zinc transporter 1
MRYTNFVPPTLVISALFLHEHDHGDGGHSHGHGHAHDHGHAEDTHAENSTASASSPRHATHNHLTINLKPKGMDLGMLGVLVHVMGDALNNIGVIIAALIIWLTKSTGRFYADPAVSLWIAIMILASSVPLTKRSGAILLQSAPPGVNLDHVRKDLESIPGVKGVHELHVWRLDQKKTVASAHVVVSEESLGKFMEKAQVFSECLHAYGIHSATLQPELVVSDSEGEKCEGDRSGVATASGSGASSVAGSLRLRAAKCGLTCGTLCEPLMCCN